MFFFFVLFFFFLFCVFFFFFFFVVVVDVVVVVVLFFFVFFVLFFFFFLFFSALSALLSPRLGKRELVYVLLVNLFVYFACVGSCPFSFPLGVRGWLRLMIVALRVLFINTHVKPGIFKSTAE